MAQYMDLVEGLQHLSHYSGTFASTLNRHYVAIYGYVALFHSPLTGSLVRWHRLKSQHEDEATAERCFLQ